jgi:HEAT repeat protein
MSKVLASPNAAEKSLTASRKQNFRLSKRLRAALFVLTFATLALVPSLAPLAQRVKDSQSPVNLTDVKTRQTSGGTVVSISADAPLNRTQTWQDGDKFHLVVPYAEGRSLRNLPRGVRVNRVSNSLEIVVNMKSGASVTVDPRFNQLNLIVNGGINSANNDEDAAGKAVAPPVERASQQQRAATKETYEPSTHPARDWEAPAERRAPALPFVSSSSFVASKKTFPASSSPFKEQAASSAPAKEQAQSIDNAGPATSASNPAAIPAASATPAVNPATSTQLVPAQDDSLAPAGSTTASNASAPPPAQSPAVESRSFFSLIFSTTGVAILISMGLLALVYLRLRPATEGDAAEDSVEKDAAKEKTKDEEQQLALVTTTTTDAPVVKTEQRKGERRRLLRRKSDKQSAPASPAQLQGATEQSLEVRTPQATVAQAALFGAYRVDQEVGKLVLGQPHRMDVLASRASDDRRAIETSLLKAMKAPETEEDGRRRARQALEEYGFLARHSAALLLAQDACERASAARTLGDIGQPSALPFLLEALYDAESIVRTQAVSSIGVLKLPSAIGALLDMARRHPEMPAALLSQTLSACSLDCLEIGGLFEPEQQLLSGETTGDFKGDITRLEPSATFEQLPEFLEDETMAEALERLENTDIEVRTAAARRLAQFQTQGSVAALTALAARDPESLVRAAAVASLGEIDHESVFAPVLMAFADEAREVQAAAARALSRLSFNRADAYVRIIETADKESLVNVARACIKARMAAQAIDRLASEDRRQAYEAFSMLSLLAQAGETAPILDAIAEHADINVQMAAVRLLGMTGRPEVAQQFRQLVVRDGLPEKVRTALLEIVYKIDQALPA